MTTNTTVSMRDVARAAGVSAATVSKVLSNRMGLTKVSPATRQKIFNAARTLNYEPNVNARRLFQQKTGVLGLVAPYSLVPKAHGLLTDQHLIDILNGMEAAVAAEGYRILLIGKDEAFVADKGYLRIFRSKLVDGVFIWGALRGEDFYRELAENGFPHVFITTRPEGPSEGPPFLRPDYAAAASAVMGHLLERGHRRIAWCRHDAKSTSLYDELERGARRAVAEAGLSWETTVSVVSPEGLENGFSFHDGCRFAEWILSQKHPADALALISRTAARGCLEYFVKHGRRVPEDYALACFDSTALPEPSLVQITRCVCDDYQLGRRAAERLMGLIDGAASPAVSDEPVPVSFLPGDTS